MSISAQFVYLLFVGDEVQPFVFWTRESAEAWAGREPARSFRPVPVYGLSEDVPDLG